MLETVVVVVAAIIIIGVIMYIRGYRIFWRRPDCPIGMDDKDIQMTPEESIRVLESMIGKKISDDVKKMYIEKLKEKGLCKEESTEKRS